MSIPASTASFLVRTFFVLSGSAGPISVVGIVKFGLGSLAPFLVAVPDLPSEFKFGS